MRINHNIAALNTHRQLNSANNAQSNSMEKLSSGLRINKAGDDAAGLAISEKMRGQIRGLDQAGKNAQDSISMIQTAEGALNETHDILQRMRELAVQAGNDTNTSTDRGEIQKEINQLTSEVNRIGNTTEFNNQKLLNASAGDVSEGASATTIASPTAMTGDSGNTAGAEVDISGTFTGSADETLTIQKTASGWSIDGGSSDVTLSGSDFSYKGMTLDTSTATGVATGDSWTQSLEAATPRASSFSSQIGANENQTMTLEFSDMRASALGITGAASDAGFTSANTVTDGTNNTTNEAALDVSTAANAGNAVTAIQSAIDNVSAERSKLGANQNRLEHTINNLSTSSENLTAAESRIRDVDMAKEMMNQTKQSILSQASQAMLAKANQQPQGVLQLLR
ncbi:flagellin N-terminal helical domain-containing protein [Salimicrobium humidisoli]|uniref:Flagellin n=1 Tax=Salimicrobium humidisoli TaxID=2029857 RepID=A0ABX4HSE3_9BACI|nr:flagellin [Salimicrobium humidisoli]PBB05620.1 flagellin [Salimicrobium humidisoli]